MRTRCPLCLWTYFLVVSPVAAQPVNLMEATRITGWMYYSSASAVEYEEAQNRYLLLRIPGVPQELGIDAEQQKRLDEMFAEFQAATQPLMPQRPVPGPGVIRRQPEDRQKSVELQKQRLELQQRLSGQSLEILYAEQRGRLEQLFLQHLGAKALLRSDVADQIKLTHAQMDTLKALLNGPRMNPFEDPLGINNNPGQPRNIQNLQAEFEKRRVEQEARQRRFETEALQLLSAEQRAAFAQLLGEKFAIREVPRPVRIPAPRIPPAPFLPEA